MERCITTVVDHVELHEIEEIEHVGKPAPLTELEDIDGWDILAGSPPYRLKQTTE